MTADGWLLTITRGFMFRILDRYLIREILLPFFLGLVVLTFLLQVPPFLQQSQAFIAKGVPLATVIHALYMLLPQALSITIPMAVLLGILVGFGRLAADREFVAMQACGVSLLRLLRPGRAHRHRRHGGDRLRNDRRPARCEPDVPHHYLQRRGAED